MSSKRPPRGIADFLGELEDEPSGASATPPSATVRAGEGALIVPINILVTPTDRKRLRQLSLDSGLSVQKLGHEAWNLLLEIRGLPPLEKVSANVPSGRQRR